MGGFDLFLLKTASLFRELMLRRYEMIGWSTWFLDHTMEW
jgi:hypothetical protein